MNGTKRSLTTLAVLTMMTTGCAAGQVSAVAPGVKGAGASGGPNAKPRGDDVQRLDPVVVRAYDSGQILADFKRARVLLKEGKDEQAIVIFDRLSAQTADRNVAALSLFNAGVAYQHLSKFDDALVRHRRVVEGFENHRIVVPSLIRTTRLLGYLERWQDLSATAGKLIARKTLPVMDRIEALGAMALGLVQQGKDEEAERYVNRARDIIEEKQFGRAGTPPVQLAQVAFAEGEIRRLRSERIKLVPVTPDFLEVLEKRCGGLLSAQRAYTDAMRSRDSHWSAMAGFRVGQLYETLHSEAMQIPAPEDTPKDKKVLFGAAMRLRYRILLKKGLKMMDATLRIAERTGEKSEWIRRAADSKAKIERALEQEQKALSKLPYTEAEIRAALNGLKKRSD